MRRALSAVLLWIAVAASAGAEDFPRPPEIQSAIAFWTRVYTEADTNGGYLHDSRNLAVVYEKLDFGTGASTRERTRARDQAADKYQAILRKLANGSRSGLSADEARVLSLWPAGTSNAEFALAADQIRFQLGQSDRFLAGLIRSGRYRNHIEGLLDAAGLPRELGVLPHVESSFDPTAYSKVGAAGMWQFTRSTGLRYMQIDHIVDERRDPFLSSDAALRLLKDNYDVIGSWPLALTAYNHGLGGMRRAVREVGSNDIGKIITDYDGRSFGFASRNFYPAFVAALDVDRNPEQFFGAVKPDQPFEAIVVELPDYVDAAPLATAWKISLTELRAFNPALMDSVWQGDKYVPRGFPIRLPPAAGREPSALIAAIPTQQRFAAQRPDLYHRVQNGDTVSGIAARYGVSQSALVSANGLNNRNLIRVGQQLTLPVAGREIVAAAPASPVVASAPIAPPPAAAAEHEPPTPAQPKAETVAAVREAAEEAQDDEAPVEPEENLLASSQTTLAADPSDYTVAGDNTIEVQDMETLGHYADWLELRTQRLRDINRMPFEQAVVVGERIRLDFSNVDTALFEARRVAYQSERQDSFFLAYQIDEIVNHVVESGESLWLLALRQYDVPVWLLRQYNPDIELDRVRPGTVVRFPRLRPIGDKAG